MKNLFEENPELQRKLEEAIASDGQIKVLEKQKQVLIEKEKRRGECILKFVQQMVDRNKEISLDLHRINKQIKSLQNTKRVMRRRWLVRLKRITAHKHNAKFKSSCYRGVGLKIGHRKQLIARAIVTRFMREQIEKTAKEALRKAWRKKNNIPEEGYEAQKEPVGNIQRYNQDRARRKDSNHQVKGSPGSNEDRQGLQGKGAGGRGQGDAIDSRSSQPTHERAQDHNDGADTGIYHLDAERGDVGTIDRRSDEGAPCLDEGRRGDGVPPGIGDRSAHLKVDQCDGRTEAHNPTPQPVGDCQPV